MAAPSPCESCDEIDLFRYRRDDRLHTVPWVGLASREHQAALLQQFAKLEFTNCLIIGGAEIEANFSRAARNIPHIDVLPVQGINVYDILRRKKLVLTKDAVEALEARFK